MLSLMDAGALVRTARRQAGLSLTALAQASGASRSGLTEVENGRRSPTVRTLDGLLQACGLQLRVTLEPYLADVPVWTLVGFVQLRFLDDVVTPIIVLCDDLVLPVLPLREVEQAAPQLADILARWRQRRAR